MAEAFNSNTFTTLGIYKFILKISLKCPIQFYTDVVKINLMKRVIICLITLYIYIYIIK